MKTTPFALFVSLLAVSEAYADPVCNTLDDCPSLQAEVDARITEPSFTSGPSDVGDVARDNAGNIILRKSQPDAAKYCKDHGSRLPTIREFALAATEYGAKISDTPQNGFDEIDGSDAAGNPDKFYYQYSGYNVPSGNFGTYWFWSLSVVPGDSRHAYSLTGWKGDLYPAQTELASFYNNAIRCVR